MPATKAAAYEIPFEVEDDLSTTHAEVLERWRKAGGA